MCAAPFHRYFLGFGLTQFVSFVRFVFTFVHSRTWYKFQFSNLKFNHFRDFSDFRVTLFCVSSRLLAALHGVKERIRPIGVKHLIAIHHRHQILSVADVDNVMGISRQYFLNVRTVLFVRNN